MATRQSLVLLPGLFCTEFVWRDRLEALEDLAETMVASTQRGHDSPCAVADRPPKRGRSADHETPAPHRIHE